MEGLINLWKKIIWTDIVEVCVYRIVFSAMTFLPRFFSEALKSGRSVFLDYLLDTRGRKNLIVISA